MLLSVFLAHKYIEKDSWKKAGIFAITIWVIGLFIENIGTTIPNVILSLIAVYLLARYAFKLKRPMALTLTTLIIALILTVIIAILGLAVLGMAFLGSIVA